MPTKILAIDDSKTMRLAIKITFAAEDADVTSVGSGADAVARAKQLGADVVLLDAELAPGDVGGLEVCRQLKNDSATSKIPVIVMVSNQSPPASADVLDAGADETLVKPFDTQELIDLVAAVQGKPARAAAPATTTPAAKPPVAAAAAAAPVPIAAGRTPASPVAAAPAVAASRVAPAPAPAPAAKPAIGRGARVGPASAPPPATAAKSARVGGITEIGMPTPIKGEDNGAARPSSAPAARMDAGAAIPIAIPIPFTSAASPTSGMIERLQRAAGDSGLDPHVAQALVNLSREVIERVVWEVVPELAESIIKRAADAPRPSA